ncbi:MAG: hypothetical protein JSW03_06720 [Candidatus Eiseniibacteriota bacterium]|nr:MAG: hypothetical protein JSW03_06720 [Candidatus Eisenbacteria bacterium]
MKEAKARSISALLITLYMITALLPHSLVVCRSAEGRVAVELGQGNSCFSSVILPRDGADEVKAEWDSEGSCGSCFDTPLGKDKEHTLSRDRRETPGGASPCYLVETGRRSVPDITSRRDRVLPAYLKPPIPLPVRSAVLLI